MSSQNISNTTTSRTGIEIIELLNQSNQKFLICSHKFGNNINVSWESATINSADVRSSMFFIGLQGTTHNGGEFFVEAIEQGASIILIENILMQEILDYFDSKSQERSILVIFVDNALNTMCAIARQIRINQFPSCQIIAITGSAGKTSTKKILHAILDEYKGAVSSIGNLNTVQGLSQCIINTKWENKCFGVFEFGISEVGEMQELVQVLLPDYAVVTNVGLAHIGGFPSQNILRKEKLSIAQNIPPHKYFQFEGLLPDHKNILWIPDNDPELLEIAQSLNFDCTIATFGEQSYKGYVGWEDKHLNGFCIICNHEKFETPLLGKVNMVNSLAALEIADYFTVPRSLSAKVLQNIVLERGRYQILSENPLVIDDSYNANPESMKTAMTWFSSLSIHPKIAVLGGMKELGEESSRQHQELIQHCLTLDIEQLLVIGEEYNTITNHKNVHHLSVEEVQLYLQTHLPSQGSVMFKGSRYYELDKIAKNLLNLELS